MSSYSVTRSRSHRTGLTRKSAPESKKAASMESTDDPLRFDKSDDVQVFFNFKNTGDATLQQIRNPRAFIETVNSDWNSMQAWAPVFYPDPHCRTGNSTQDHSPALRRSQ